MSFVYFEYSKVLVFVCFALVLSVLILGLSVLFSKQAADAEKLSAYECGFDPFEDARNQFDVRFYLVAILFIIFDLEATFVFPWAISLGLLDQADCIFAYWSITDFIFELIVGFIYAWNVGSLEWLFYFMSSFNFEFLVPELFFSLMLLLLLFWGSFFQTKGTSSISVEKPVTWLIIWLFLCFVFVNLSFSDLLVIGDNNSLTVYLINGVLVLSPFTSFIKTCIGFFSFCVLFAIFRFFNIGVIRRYEFPIIIGFASFGIILLVSSNDIISVYLAIETQALATYVIAGYSIRSAFSTESGLKYFVIGSLSSGLFLLGSVLLYLNLGSTFFPDMHSLLNIIGTSQMSVNFGFLLVIVALFFKLGIAPFHMWLPDVYQGAPTPSVIFFAVVSKLAVFALVVRFCIDVFEPLFGLVQPVFLVFGILSLLIGSFGALFQKTLKRFLAFSSISHSGYLLLTVASHNTVSVQSFLIYSVIYIIMGLCVWTIVANLVGNYTFFHKIPNIKYIADLSGLVKIHPILAIIVSLLLFSIAGIPPLAGFFSKYSVFLSILNSGFIVVSVFVAFCSMIGAFYYLRWVKIIYADRLVINAQKTFLFDFRFSYSESLLLSAFCLFIVLFFIDPQPLLAYFYFISIEFL